MKSLFRYPRKIRGNLFVLLYGFTIAPNFSLAYANSIIYIDCYAVGIYNAGRTISALKLDYINPVKPCTCTK